MYELETADPNMFSELKRIADVQFSQHEEINIYRIGKSLHFSEETRALLTGRRKDLAALSPMQKDALCGHCKAMFIQSCYGVNQYTYFSKKHELIISEIYKTLLQDLENLNLEIETIEHSHYEKIKNFMANTNSAVYNLNFNRDAKAKKFVCEEYSAEFLLELLGLELNNLMEPILDIGCGQYGLLVGYLQSCGLEACGFDRNARGANIGAKDWLTYEYGENKWGLIVSNLAFSSHFLYHHLQNETIADLYARAYMNILKSLKANGKWIYAPSIDFFENLLPRDLYVVERTKIHEDFSRTTIVKR